MLHRYIFISQLLRLVLRADQDFIQISPYVYLTALNLGAFGKGLFHTADKMLLLNLHLLYQLQDQAVFYGEETVEKMLLLDFLIAVFIG